MADRVFAPHYAAALPRTLARAASLEVGEHMVELGAGDRFEVLEIAGGKAWGVAPERQLVGYLDADALASA